MRHTVIFICPDKILIVSLHYLLFFKRKTVANLSWERLSPRKYVNIVRTKGPINYKSTLFITTNCNKTIIKSYDRRKRKQWAEAMTNLRTKDKATTFTVRLQKNMHFNTTEEYAFFLILATQI